MSNPAVPRVSVVVIAFNAEPYLASTLESVLAQDWGNLEIIVVDDGSTDGTKRCAQAFGERIRYLYQENSGGCSKPRNTGVAASTGDFIAFIDSDDLMAIGRISREARVLLDHPHVGLVFSDYQDFDDSGVHAQGHFSSCALLSERLQALPTDAVSLVLDPADSTELLLTENFGSSSPMVRRTAYQEAGGFDETLKASEDFDFQYRVASLHPIGVIGCTGWYKRLHGSSMSSNAPNVLRHKILTRQRLLDRETHPRRRRKLKQRLALYHAQLGYYYTGRHNALALRHGLASVTLARRPHARLFARLALDLLGRNTNHLQQH